MSRIFQPFSPNGEVLVQNEKRLPRWIELSVGLEALTLIELREKNAHWFSQSIAFELTKPMLWLVNIELTRRGIAPQWRGVPRFVRVARVPPTSPLSAGPRRLGEVAQKNLMKRWIDLDWLRRVLGVSHVTKQKSWQDVFSADDDRAYRAFAKVNLINSHSTERIGPANSAYEVMYKLDVPDLLRLGLTGLMNRDAGELVHNAGKRLKRTVRPRLEGLMARPAYPLTAEGVERRMIYAEAIELAVGSPTDAVTVYGWMTGDSVTRQSMHEMKTKLAEQCKLTTRAWRPKKS